MDSLINLTSKTKSSRPHTDCKTYRLFEGTLRQTLGVKFINPKSGITCTVLSKNLGQTYKHVKNE